MYCSRAALHIYLYRVWVRIGELGEVVKFLGGGYCLSGQGARTSKLTDLHHSFDWLAEVDARGL